MATPPARTEISDTYPNPSNGVARAGFGKLYDYVTGLLGASGNAAEARAALGVSNTQWIPEGITPTYISTSSFSFTGNRTVDYHVGRRLQMVVTGGAIVYGNIITSVYTSLTTVTLQMDAGMVLDSGLSAVNPSILRADVNALPSTINQSFTMVGVSVIEGKGATVTAAATTLVFGATDGNTVDISGNTGISSLGTSGLPIGYTVGGTITGTPTITPSASLTLNSGGAPIICHAGDTYEAWATSATTANMNVTRADGAAITSVNPIVGMSRNLIGSAAGSTKTASWTADQLVAAAALNGVSVLGSSLTLAFNGATTGAGGMDTGSTPTSADLHIYAIYKLGTGWNTLGTITGSGSSVYSGANIPSGYTASCLIWSGKTDSSGNIIKFNQLDRSITIAATQVASSAVTTYTSFSLATWLPINTRTISGYAFDGGAAQPAYIASSITGIGQQLFSSSGPYTNLMIITAQTFYFYTGSGQGTTINVNSYTI